MLVEIEVEDKTIEEIEKAIAYENKTIKASTTTESIISELLKWNRVKSSNFFLRYTKLRDEVEDCAIWLNDKNKRIANYREFVLNNKKIQNIFDIAKNKREELFGLIREEFDKLESCKKCKTCCCRNHYGYFEDRDLMYLAIIGKTLSITPELIFERVKRNEKCIFLSKKGCTLEYNIRPFTCVTALCSEINDELRKKKLYNKVSKLQNEIHSIGSLISALTRVKL